MWWVTDKHQINASAWSGDTERSGVTGISYCATVRRQTSNVYQPLNSCSPSPKSILTSSAYNSEIICFSLYTSCQSKATHPKHLGLAYFYDILRYDFFQSILSVYSMLILENFTNILPPKIILNGKEAKLENFYVKCVWNFSMGKKMKEVQD